MRRFEYKDEKSDKFWEIDQTKNALTTRWGRIGTKGQSKTKDYADEAAAGAALEKQIDEKTGKGYQEVPVEVGASLNPAPVAAPVAPQPKPAPPTAVEAEPGLATPSEAPDSPTEVPPESAAGQIGGRPWLENQPPYRVPTKDFAPLFSRKHPPKDAAKASNPSFKDTLAAFKTRYRFDADRSDPRFTGAINELASLPAGPADRPEISEEAAALIMATALSQIDFWDGRKLKEDLIIHFFNYFDAEKFIGIFMAAEQISPMADYGATNRLKWVFSEASDNLFSFFEKFLSDGETTVRHLLARTSPEQWLKCQKAVLDHLDSLPLIRQPIVALIMPDSPEVSNRAARTLLAQSQAPCTVKALRLTETDESLKTAVAQADVYYPGHYGAANFDFSVDPVMCDTLLLERGEGALNIFLAQADEAHIGHLLAHINDPRAVEALASAARKGAKSALVNSQAAIVNWPRAAMAGLGRLLAGHGRDYAFLRPTFINLCRQHPDDFQAMSAWFDPATLAAATEILNSNQVAETAALAKLPAVLADPPWTKKRIKKDLKTFALEPLALDPVLNWSEEERRQYIQITEDGYDKNYLRKVKDPAYLFSDHILRLRVGAGGSKLAPDKQKLADQVLDRARNEDADGLMAALKDYFQQTDGDTSFWPSWLDGVDAGLLPETLGVAFFNTFAGRYERVYSLDYPLARFGLAITPGLLAQFKRRLTADLMDVAARIGLVELAPYMARAFAKLKNFYGTGRKWLLHFPGQAACGLIAQALGPKSEARDWAATALRLLNDRGHHGLIMETAGRYQNPEVSAALAEVLNESPLDMFPARIPALPACWQPAAWRPPLVAEGPEKGKALPPEAIERLGTMLAFPMAEGWYAGLDIVKTLCTKESLAAFSWDMFNTWLNSGGPSKDKWCFLALGLFGDDDTARKLTPYIREWPGLAAHARAVMGLEVLKEIGSDVALMQLNGIAQKVKFKGLQDKAREMIQGIAEDRGLTTEELEDRLAPDFGLNEQGSLELDFGPRQFVVGFDEALKPYVKDAGGKRLAGLPNPAKSDDQALAAEASERFKGLKKDVRTVAGQQILRLEQAMCGRRHWNRANFEDFLVRHPLVRHLTQRLVWAAYLMEPDAEGQYSNYGGRPAGFFRVSEDGSYTNALDEPYQLPEEEGLRLGIPHILEMPPEAQTEFGQLFADYELIQPFPQLGRETYSLTEAEKDKTELARWPELEVPTGAIIGLVSRGWRRGTPQDAGWVGWMYKSFGQGLSALMQLNEGFCVGYTEMSESQKVENILIGSMKDGWEHIPSPLALKEVDPIIISELIRDMEILTRKAEA